MALIEEIKKRALLAMKARNTVEKEVLRVALGEIQVAEARASGISDDEIHAIIKKLVKSNQETLELSANDEQKRILSEEIAILESLLPQTLSVEEIVERLDGLAQELRAAKSSGQATGLAVKYLKSSNASVNGKDVAVAVERIRS
jgi:uncharacterized protein